MSTPESEPTAPDERLSSLGETIERLGRSREGIIDPIGVAHARRLHARARELPESIRGQLLDRVKVSIDAIHARVEREQTRAARRIEAIGVEGVDVSALRTRLARGETRQVEHEYRRRMRLGREARRRDPAIEAKLASLARTNGIAVDPDRPMPVFEVASRLYERSAANASAAFLMDRVDSAPRVDAGRYHGESVIATVLGAMRDVSPTYLRAQLAKLAMIGEIGNFLAAFEPEPPPRDETRGKSKRSRSKKKG